MHQQFLEQQHAALLALKKDEEERIGRKQIAFRRGVPPQEVEDQCGKVQGMRDSATVALEIDAARKNLCEIEWALHAIREGKYGMCIACETDIPAARLKAYPQASFCITCAEAAEATGATKMFSYSPSSLRP